MALGGLAAACGQGPRASEPLTSGPQQLSPRPIGDPLPAASAAAPLRSPEPGVPDMLTRGVVIDSSGIRLQGDVGPLVPMPADPAKGADAVYKRSGPNDLYLVPLAQALEREAAAGRLSHPLRVIADEQVAYRVLLEMLYTAGQTKVAEFLICEQQCDARSFSFVAPKPGPPPHGLEHGLHLTAVVAAAGSAVKSMGGNMAPGCHGVGSGVAIPRSGSSLDLAAFSTCISTLKTSDPGFAAEDTATLVASADTPLREVMSVALALQGPSKSLFPKLILGVPK
jgi:hypothetical protein